MIRDSQTCVLDKKRLIFNSHLRTEKIGMRKIKFTYSSLLSYILAFALVIFFASAKASELRILHINDFHGFVESQNLLPSHELRGGAAYLAWEIDNLRKEKPSILLAAGDMIQGNTWINLFEGKPIIAVMNAMNFDAMVLGNHEFDFGKSALLERIKEAKFPILAANVLGLGEFTKPYIIKKVDGIKIGIIGVVTQETPTSTHPKNVEGLTFLPPEKALQKYVRELRAKVDVIIVLSHLGYKIDLSIAHKIPNIDVIIGGHSHTKLDKYVKVGKTIIVQAGEHGLFLGVLDLTLQNGKIINASNKLVEIIPAKMKPQPKVAHIIDNYAKEVKATLNKVIGESKANYDGENVRIKETDLGHIIAEIIRERARADISILNGGSIRAGLKRGKITVKDIYEILPFNNYVLAFKLTGKEIKASLEEGLSGLDLRKGGFPQVSGMTFTFSSKMPAGHRVINISVNDKPIEMKKEYVVATNDFLASGGDGYTVFEKAIKRAKNFSIIGDVIKSDSLVYNDAGHWLRDVVIEAISEKRKI